MKRVLISGANRGIGLELVRQCLARGDRVFAGCRQPGEAAELLTLAAAAPDRLTILALDITTESTIDAVAERRRRSDRCEVHRGENRWRGLPRYV